MLSQLSLLAQGKWAEAGLEEHSPRLGGMASVGGSSLKMVTCPLIGVGHLVCEVAAEWSPNFGGSWMDHIRIWVSRHDLDQSNSQCGPLVIPLAQDIVFGVAQRDASLRNVELSHRRALVNVQQHIFLTPIGSASDSNLPRYFGVSDTSVAGTPTAGLVHYCPPASPSDATHTLLEFHEVDRVLLEAAVKGVAGCPLLPEPALRVSQQQMKVWTVEWGNEV